MARGFKRKGELFVAKLDAVERGLVVGLMEQVRELLEPDEPGGDSASRSAKEQGGDAFDQIVAGLGGSGWGVSVSPEDQVPGAPASPGALEDRDPALDRLLPPAHREDEQIAAEFRRFTEHGLRARKTANLSTAIAALSGAEEQRVELDQPQAVALVVALTDVRLVLGERLGLRTDEDLELIEEQVSSLDDDDPAVYALAVYDFLTWLQQTLAHALNR
ncbi:protein of unknown function [Pedococcus cremeus]|uniref:Uncharacterized protein n=1 Tax=Pedococcus cremeus TaxID=587636 RepID=A0A1H9UK87_9MICO|nr:DUF2017 domain-containing protein [Pedococcus cremeus]SES09739.1 protein of unknown function [Pedococcus cremeus]